MRMNMLIIVQFAAAALLLLGSALIFHALLRLERTPEAVAHATRRRAARPTAAPSDLPRAA